MEATALIGPTISAVSAAVSFYFSRKSRSAVKIQQRMQLLTLQRHNDSDLRQWAGEAVSVLSEATMFCYDEVISLHGNRFVEPRNSLLCRLSAIIDRGRWFLPNEKTDLKGHLKPVAYQGFRPAALDALVEAFELLTNLSGTNSVQTAEVRNKLVDVRREFVSAIQEKLDPRTREKQLSDAARGVMTFDA